MDKHRNGNRHLAYLRPLEVVDGLRLQDMKGARGIIFARVNEGNLGKNLDTWSSDDFLVRPLFKLCENRARNHGLPVLHTSCA
jgi:hypothetical protein